MKNDAKTSVRLLTALALALLVAGASDQVGFAQDTGKLVAVLELTNTAGVTDSEAYFLTNTVRNVASQALPPARFTIMTRENIDALLPPGVNWKNCTDSKCEIEMGQKLGAEYIVTGEILRYGGALRIQLNLHHVPSKAFLGGRNTPAGALETQEPAVAAAARENMNAILQHARVSAAPAAGGAVFVQPTPRAAPSAEAELREIKPSAAPAAGAAGPAGLYITSDPAGARVFLGDAEAGSAAPAFQKINLQAGTTVRVTLKLDLYHDLSFDVALVPGIQKFENVPLKPAFGSLTIESEPSGAKVLLGGKEVGKTPYVNARQPSGSYLVSLELAWYAPLQDQTIAVRDGETTKQTYRLAADFGTLEAASNPPGAEVTLNGKKLGATPSSFRVAPVQNGKLEIALAGHRRKTFEVSIDRGQTVKIAAEQATLTAKLGALQVYADPPEPGAKVFLDGKEVGAAPLTLQSVAEGAHEIRVESAENQGAATIAVVDGQTAVAEVPLVSKERARQIEANRKACDKGNAAACYDVGQAYLKGKGVPKDAAQAAKLYARACDRGHNEACSDLANQYLAGEGVAKDGAAAAALLSKACDRGGVEQCSSLAGLYRRGEAIPPDLAKAATFYAKVCDQGHAYGCYALGVMYERGEGVPKDLTRAAAFFAKACDGIALPVIYSQAGCFSLGALTERGDGVPKDQKKAAALYAKASDGKAAGYSTLAAVYADSAWWKEDWFTDAAKAAALYRMACEGGDLTGCRRLGVMHERGRGVERDRAKALALNRKACDGGDSGGCLELGIIYYLGRNSPSDHARAAEYFAKACEAGKGQGCHGLGLMHQYGDGVARDVGRARELYKKGCDQGESGACMKSAATGPAEERAAFLTELAGKYEKACEEGTARHCAQLGWMHELGLGVPRSMEKAEALYEKSCNAQRRNETGCLALAGLLADKARAATGDEATRLSALAREKAQRAAEEYQKQCDHGDVAGCDGLGRSLLVLAKLATGAAADKLFAAARQKCMTAEEMGSGSSAFGLARLAALQGNEADCRSWLDAARRRGWLTWVEFLENDHDLDSVRGKDWFKALLADVTGAPAADPAR